DGRRAGGDDQRRGSRDRHPAAARGADPRRDADRELTRSGGDAACRRQVDARAAVQLHSAALMADAGDMTRPRPLRRFDPFRPIDMLTSLWSSAAVAPVSTGAAAAYRTLFMTVRRLVVGRRLSVRLDDGDLALTVTEFDSGLDVRGLSVGQLNDVRLARRDLSGHGSRFARATAVLHNVHMKPTAPPVLVAAPVELTLEVPAPLLDALFEWAAPRLSGQGGADGIARLRLAGRPLLGHIEVDARVDGSTLCLKPSGLVIRQLRWRLPARTPAYPVRL